MCFYNKAFSQIRVDGGGYLFDADTLFFQNKVFIPGDTLHLGFGSNYNKEFLFIIQQTSDMKKRYKYLENLPYQYANAYLIYKRIDEGQFKVKGQITSFVEPIFGMKPELEKLEWTINLVSALKSGEIVLSSTN